MPKEERKIRVFKGFDKENEDLDGYQEVEIKIVVAKIGVKNILLDY